MGLIHKHNVCAVNYVMYTLSTHQKWFSHSMFDSSPTEAVVKTSTWPELNTKVSQFRNWFEINPRFFTSKRFMPGKCHDYVNICLPKAAVNVNMSTWSVMHWTLIYKSRICLRLFVFRETFQSVCTNFTAYFFMDAPDNSSYNASNIRVCSAVHVAAVH